MQLRVANASRAAEQAIGGESVWRETHHSDEQLVTETLKGSGTAFGVLFERYERKMFHTTLRVLRHREDAEDAVQQAFQRAFVHLNSFQGDSRFSTWLTRIAINEALMLLRKRRRSNAVSTADAASEDNELTLEIEDEAATPEERCEQTELNRILGDAIGELRPNLRTVVQLREIAEFSTDKTAKTLGITSGTVKARTFRARRVLRDKLAKRLGLRHNASVETLTLPKKRDAGRANRQLLFARAS
jgi:RNA polymerase sigma-70 factor (ECF subfamily)